ncbi:uncharacterized protein Tco025E_01172 [Trypanosoma conorhini]|uniref:Uncharacterized protein n=1 Tax=Trypanosoma conorhini TaxID=83891 RepID=A0A3R7PX00_9TRYP|nr:uncharacterized protein Tco025E_01172 [Trypanosoma conorhini]RNF26450.1 hypothetical protein Tco025E_01172 [Trypanosoma conorhini]
MTEVAASVMDTHALSVRLDEVLHLFATREEDKSDNTKLLSEVAVLTQAVEAMVASMSAAAATKEGGVSPPVKTLEELRFLGSSCWNMTVRHSPREDSLDERVLKSSLRNFATKAFLLGNYAYAPRDVSHSYFAHHPREAEQCVLMCLKASRDLSLCGVAGSAKELLSVGETVASYIRAGVKNSLAHLKHRNMSWEFAYTDMDITWNLRHYQESCEAAKKLAQMLLKDHDLLREHREAFFRFVFTVGNSTLPLSEEQYMRDMLQSSLEVQNHFQRAGRSDPSHHDLMLHGATMEQLALSWLREGKATEALSWAVEADAALHSSTSALLRLTATAKAGMETEAVALLHQYVHRSDASVDDAVAACFEVHNLLVETKEGSIEGMRLLYSKAKGKSSSEVVAFRLTQLLLHNGSLASCKEALHILQNEGIDFEEARHRRYCFLWIWELADTAEFAPLQLVDCLETALRFKDCASDTELDAIYLRLCTEYITQSEDSEKPSNALTRAKHILLDYTSGRNPQCPFAHTLLFKVAVLEANEGDLETELNRLLLCQPAELVMPALCTALNYSLRRGYLHGVSVVITRALFSSAPVPDYPTELELLRVYVASLLGRACDCTDEQLRVVTERFQRLLSDECATLALSHDEVTWWVQAFLILGSEFTDGPNPTSVFLFRAAMLVALQDPAPGEGASRAFLISALLCMLEDEFQLFATGSPQITPGELEEQLRVCKESVASLPDMNHRLTFLLAEAEGHLRRPSAETPEHIQRIVDELSTLPATFKDHEALAEGSSFMALQYASEYPFLHGVTIKLYMRAVSLAMNDIAASLKCDDSSAEKCTGHVTDALSCLYKAFTLAFDRTEQLSVVQRLMELMSLSVEDVTVASFIKHSNAVRAVTNHPLSFVRPFLEYFTVEAWNNSVFYLILTETAKQAEWAHVAWTLVETLPDTSSVASALLALKAITTV